MIGLLAVAIVCGTSLLGGRSVLRAWSRRSENDLRAWQAEKFAQAGRDNIQAINDRDQREADRAVELRRLALEEKRQRDTDLDRVRNGNSRDNIAAVTHALEARRIAVEERRITLEEKRAEKPTATRMPDALLERIRAYDEPFAQDEERTRIMSLYADLQDWDKVAAQLPTLNPFVTEDIAAPRDGMIQ